MSTWAIIYKAGAVADDPRNAKITRQIAGVRVTEIYPSRAASRAARRAYGIL